METFASRLKQLRIQHGYTQKKVAGDMDMTFSALSQYETGKRTPKNDILIRLATYFDVSVDYLLGRDDNPHKSYNAYSSFSKTGQYAASANTYVYQTDADDEHVSADLAASKARILSAINRLPTTKQMEVLAAIELILGTIVS